MYPENYRYTKEHEWIQLSADNSGIVTIGITAYAQGELGDIVYVEAPKVGTHIEQGKSCAVIESVKTASELLAPVSGEIVEANGALTATPELVNSDPHGAGWIARVKISTPSEMDHLLSAADYEAFIKKPE